jgi:hypothetical protein
MVFNAISNTNNSVIPWWSVLLVEETRVPGVSIKLCRIPMLILEQVSMLNSKTDYRDIPGK